ncbi:MAG TPA: hypothetical protein VK858_15100 [Longimicrobiales bacterium]|nr:hypothetical protein [Longimicrobiales bacterium]
MRSLILAVVVLLVSACSSARTPYANGEDQARTIELEVVNLNFNQATLYTIRFSERRRLGIVQGKGTETFRIPWEHSAPLRVEMHILSGDSCTTYEMNVDPGDALYLEVAANLSADPDCS